jgi:hypothetical protein
MAANRLTPLERAFQLASSGQVSDVSEIKVRLAREGHSTVQIQGLALLRQLRQLIKASKIIH